MENLRIQKYLADNGICSRRKAEQHIAAGDVLINGIPALIGQKLNPSCDKVVFCGKDVGGEKGLFYLMLNKPRGYITTMQDEQGRRCVSDLIADFPHRVVSVGRLDRNSEGLLLLTNDGDLVYRLTHPRHNINKYYLVTIAGKISDGTVERLNAPFVFDGAQTKPAQVSVLKRVPDRAVLRFVLSEGKNRQIRRMCEELDLRILRLKRYAVGDLKLSEVKPGKWRELEEAEVRYLKSL